MSWWNKKPDPAKLQREAATAADKAWAEAGEYIQDYQEFTIPVTFKVCGNHGIMLNAIKRDHGLNVTTAVGEEYFWAGAGKMLESAKVNLYLVAKRTNSGNRILNKWAAGHGVMRIVDLGFRLIGLRFGEAGNTDKPEYFGG